MTRPVTLWDPAVYERYKTYRDRPALDLLLQIPGDLDPSQIWDLGCGTGEHAALLAARHPGAHVHGLDSSAEMLAVAVKRTAPVDWRLGDIADFAPDVPPDLIFSNAGLHWLPDHAALFPKLMASLAPGGALACQMPADEGALHRRIVETVASASPQTAKLAAVQGVQRTEAAADYHAWLAPFAESIDIWQTTYLHVLEGDDPVMDWMRGTFLRPYLQALGEADQEAFLADLRPRLVEAFPPDATDEVLFPFPRLFIVARRSDS